jgi:hypothetical protein
LGDRAVATISQETPTLSLLYLGISFLSPVWISDKVNEAVFLKPPRHDFSAFGLLACG